MDGLLTDRYELTMVDAALQSGVAHRRAVFEVFARSLPAGRRYGVVGGTGRLLEKLDGFGFADDEIGWLLSDGVIGAETARWLGSWRFDGDVWGYREGELWFPGSPVLTIEASWAAAVLLETLVLSVLNADSAVAAAASRMVVAAQGCPLIEMGSRRTNEHAAVAAARATFVAGFDSTSNLMAGRLYGIPTRGTSSHAFTLAHDAGDEAATEAAAFAAQLRAQGVGTTLLVDTFDILDGVRRAVDAARQCGATGPGAVRIDSGDLVLETKRARALLDDLGATETAIVLSGDLDDMRIASLLEAGVPVSAFGVGTSVVTGAGAPTAGFVYKLVELDGRAVSKRSAGKATPPGRRWAWRDATTERLTQSSTPPAGEARALQVELMRGGRCVDGARMCTDVNVARAHHLRVLAELGDAGRDLGPGSPALTTEEAS